MPSPDNVAERPGECLNCGTPLSGHFCPECGQAATDLNLPLRHLFREFLETFFAFDARVFRTLVPLVVRPGFLTVEYNQGRRVRYVRPLTLFVFSSFLMFVSFTVIGLSVVNVNDQTGGPGADVPEAAEPEPDGVVEPGADGEDGRAGGAAAGGEPAGAGEPPAEGGDEAEPFLVRLLIQVVDTHEENPEHFDGVFRTHLARALFVLVPIFALLLKLLYRRSGGYYVRHLIMALHLHSFGFLTITATTVIDVLLRFEEKGPATSIGWIFILIYVFLALRRVHGQGRLKTLAKIAILFLVYGVMLSLTLIVLLIITGWTL